LNREEFDGTKVYRCPDAPEDIWNAQDFDVNSVYSVFVYLYFLIQYNINLDDQEIRSDIICA